MPLTVHSQPVRTSRLRRMAVGAVLGCLLVTMGSGCVFRRMTIESDPPGALAKVDGKEVGYTPCSFSFLYYGTREIQLLKDGYQTLTVMQKVQTPWYQWPGIEFLADNFSPQKITDRQTFRYTMQRQQVPPSNELIQRGRSFRSQAEFGQ
ncbi:PEGA domain protein [Polystyrenella longa]|uniref:PEGA domain protein n=1 Tax=Polystyrenella longa TaxID=2528007 RepID=A0A518CL02_9PLAN|nr:PEGA domain-containing protein [Polystyrenella longa]QDU79899.1 PEGA domain protein [Polystyrenella longa]